MRWTKAFRKSHGKEMATDSTFEFERRRHKPVQYNRDLYAKVIQGMGRIAEIQRAREVRFFMKRKAKAQAGKDYQEEKHLRVGGIDLLKAPGTEAHEKLKQKVGVLEPVAKNKSGAQKSGGAAATMDSRDD